MSATTLTFSQFRYVNKSFWRNPTAAFFIFAFPLIFLVIFTSLLGNGTERVGAVSMKASTYYVAAMAAFGVITSCYNYMAMGLTAQRDAGILKRIDGSPLPKASFMASRLLHSLVIAVVLVVLTAAFGKAFYSARVPSGTLLFDVLIMLVVGAASFCALGLALTALIPNADAAAPIVNASILPLLFLSGIFIPFNNSTPGWIQWVARIFPIRHFASGMLAGFTGTPFRWSDVLIVAAWGLGGLLLAIRYFSWEPRTG